MHKLKSDPVVQRETTRKWVRLALQQYQKYVVTADVKALTLATSYADEALEHAALIRDHGRTVGKVQRILDRASRAVRVSRRSRRRTKR